MSQLPAPPRKVFFCCLDPPTSFGGETSLCDFRKVYKGMDPEVRNKFEEKGVILLNNPIGLRTVTDVYQTVGHVCEKLHP